MIEEELMGKPVAIKMPVEMKVLDERLRQYGLPTYSTDGSAGVDLRACLDAPITIAPRTSVMVQSGIAVEIMKSLFGMVVPRSGLGTKHGIILSNTVGIIDSDYRGQIGISLYNNSDTTYTVQPFDRVAQLLILPVVQVAFKEVAELSDTTRSTGGFGSTGTN